MLDTVSSTLARELKIPHLVARFLVSRGVCNVVAASRIMNEGGDAELSPWGIKGMEDAGFASCVKHWIGRGGDSNFAPHRQSYIYVLGESNPDAIKDLKDLKDPKDLKAIYSLSGQRLAKPQRGINIIDGKKTVVR